MLAIKDHFSKEKITDLAHRFYSVSDDFPTEKFISKANNGLLKLEYRQRVAQIGDALIESFIDFEAFSISAIKVLEIWKENPRDYRNDFICESISHAVQHYGLARPELALDVMEGITQVFTAEWCIRPFVDQHWDILSTRFVVWAKSDNHHLRRLVTEGTRPNLPWGKKLQKLDSDHYFAFPYLMQLSGDESEYVRKSVSNHLNDFWKHHPEKLLEACTELKQNNRISTKDLRQALRNLIKTGNKNALALLDVNSFEGELVGFTCSDVVQLGEKINLQLELVSAKNQSLEIDYVFGFQRKDGKFGAKVFKGHRTSGQKNKTIDLSFSMAIKEISTRNYYPGLQYVKVQVNGELVAESQFILEI